MRSRFCANGGTARPARWDAPQRPGALEPQVEPLPQATPHTCGQHLAPPHPPPTHHMLPCRPLLSLTPLMSISPPVSRLVRSFRRLPQAPTCHPCQTPIFTKPLERYRRFQMTNNSPFFLFPPQTWLNWMACGFSVLLFFTVAFIYNASCATCYPPSNPYWTMHTLMGDPVFYLTCLLAPVAALLPRWVSGTVSPSPK